MMVKRADVPVAAVTAHARLGHRFPECMPEYPPRVVMARVRQLCDAGVLDYGVSEALPWVAESPAEAIT